MATLSLAELSRRRPNKPSRFVILLNKIKAGDSFPIDNRENIYTDSNVVIKQSPEFIRVLENVIERHNSGYTITPKDFGKEFSNRNSVVFPLETPIVKNDKEIKFISSSALLKTKEFGGDESNKSLNKEIIAYGQLNDLIMQATDNGNIAINIKVVDSNNKVVKNLKNITNVIRTRGSNNSPISDFEIQNRSGETVCYISHKWGSDPTDFGQYTGVSEKRRNKIFSHEETQEFRKSIIKWLYDISSKYGDGRFTKYMKSNISGPFSDSVIGDEGEEIFIFPPGITIGKIIKDEKLKRMAMFGQDIVDAEEKDGISKARNRNAVDFLAQGKFSLEIANNNSLEFSNNNSEWILKAGKLVSSDVDVSTIEQSYEPIFIAKYDSSRSDLGIPNCRVLIYTKEGRNVKQYVNETK
jgi:hypothetical protein